MATLVVLNSRSTTQKGKVMPYVVSDFWGSQNKKTSYENFIYPAGWRMALYGSGCHGRVQMGLYKQDGTPLAEIDHTVKGESHAIMLEFTSHDAVATTSITSQDSQRAVVEAKTSDLEYGTIQFSFSGFYFAQNLTLWRLALNNIWEQSYSIVAQESAGGGYTHIGNLRATV